MNGHELLAALYEMSPEDLNKPVFFSLPPMSSKLPWGLAIPVSQIKVDGHVRSVHEHGEKTAHHVISKDDLDTENPDHTSGILLQE